MFDPGDPTRPSIAAIILVDVLGRSGTARHEFDRVLDASLLSLPSGEREGHLGAAGVLHADEGDRQ